MDCDDYKSWQLTSRTSWLQLQWCPAGLHLALLPETLNKTAGISSQIYNLWGEWTPRASCNRFHHHVRKWSLCWTNELPFHKCNKHNHLSWYFGQWSWIALIFFGGVYPESSTHLLLIFPKHTSKMAAETVLTMNMHSRYSKGSNFLSRLCFGPLTVSILCLWFYSSLKCRKRKIGQWL